MAAGLGPSSRFSVVPGGGAVWQPLCSSAFCMDTAETKADVGSDRLRPDLIVEPSPGTSLFVMRPCHRRAADWLISVVGDVPVDDRNLEEVILAALTARFNVSLPFQAQPRVLGGRPAAPDVD